MVCGSGCVWMLSLLCALQWLPVLWEAKLLQMLYSHITRVSLFSDRGVQLNSNTSVMGHLAVLLSSSWVLEELG